MDVFLSALPSCRSLDELCLDFVKASLLYFLCPSVDFGKTKVHLKQKIHTLIIQREKASMRFILSRKKRTTPKTVSWHFFGLAGVNAFHTKF